MPRLVAERRTCFKVVYEFADSGRLISSFAQGFAACVEYVVGQAVRPKMPHSKLFVFEELSDAEYYVRQMNSQRLRIYEAECTNVVQPPDRIPDYAHSNLADFFWREWPTHESCITDDYIDYTMRAPLGTLFADTVKLIREV
jgi:hypothetical protein